MTNSPQKPVAAWKKYLFWVCMGVLGALGGLWFEYNRPVLPESGFLYEVRGRDEIWRVQGIFDTSRVTGAVIRSVVNPAPKLGAWVQLSDAGQSMIDCEPRGVCFLNHDGVYSGFIALPSADADAVTNAEISPDGTALILTLTRGETAKRRSYSAQTLEPLVTQ